MGLTATYRAFLSSHLQDLATIVRKTDRTNMPVVNLRVRFKLMFTFTLLLGSNKVSRLLSLNLSAFLTFGTLCVPTGLNTHSAMDDVLTADIFF